MEPQTGERPRFQSPYHDIIREALARTGRIGAEPRHVEAWMRIEYGTLDQLSRPRFDEEVRLAARCADEAGAEASEALAVSFGLR